MEYAKNWLTAYALIAFVLVNVYSIAISDEKTPEQQAAKDSVQANDQALVAKQSPTSELIGLLLAGLEAESYQTRRESFVQLWQTGRDVLPAVQSAMNSPNKQRAEAAATLDILIRLNVTADKPEEAAEFIGQLTSSPELALVSLCQRGYWNVAEELLETNDTLRASLKSSPYAYARLNNLVDEALDQNDAQLAWPIIRQVLPIHQALWIAAKQSLEPPRYDLNDPTNQAWAAVAHGDIPAAIGGNAPPEIKALIGLRNFDWKTLLQPDVQNSFLGNRRSASRVAANAVLLEFSGDLPDSEQLWATIFPDQGTSAKPTPEVPKPAKTNGQPPFNEDNSQSVNFGDEKKQDGGANQNDEPALTQNDASQASKTDPAVLAVLESLQNDPPNLERLLLTMLMTGRAQAVQDYLLKHDPEAAWGFCLARGDQDAALRSLEISPDFKDFDEWVVTKRDQLHKEAANFFASSTNFRTTVQLANILLGLGRSEEADAVYEILIDVCRASRQNQRACWTTLITSMNRAESRVRCLQIVKENYARMNEEIRSVVFQSMFPEIPVSAATLFDTAPEIPGEDGKLSKWEALEQLWRWNRSKFEPQSTKTLTGWLRRARNELFESDGLNSLNLAELADLAKGVGLRDLAIEFASDSEQGGTELWSKAGELLVERGEIDSAIKYLSAVRRYDGGRQESIVDEANALMMTGQFDEAMRLQKSRWLRPMMVHGNANSWYLVAKRCADAERFELALEFIEPTLKFVGIDNEDDRAQQALLYTTLLYSEIADGLKDTQRSADVRRTMLLSLLPADSISLSQSFYNSVAAKERLYRALLAVRAGDLEAFQRHAQVAESLQPQGIDLVEDTYHELIANGKADVAEQLFRRFESRLLTHLERWPQDATSHNNLAWMYARCDRQIDDALRHAQNAVELSPHSAVLLDTLAEVYFCRKQYSEAISAMQRCIALDPRETHLRRQLERFMQAAVADTK